MHLVSKCMLMTECLFLLFCNQILIHFVFQLSLVGSEVVGAEAVHSISFLSFLLLGVLYLMIRLFNQF